MNRLVYLRRAQSAKAGSASTIDLRPSARSRSRAHVGVGCWVLAAGLAVLALPSVPAGAIGTSVGLGTAGSYSVLGGQTVTNTGPSVLSGNVGVSPGTAIDGFTPNMIGGSQHAADAHALQAQTDLTVAYNNAAGQASDGSVAGDLGNQTLLPGVYTASSSIGLTGPLTLDANGDPNAVFIFQIGTTLTTASDSSVVLTDGAQACNVFWQIGSSATLGTDTTFVGTIMALTSITLTTGATVDGRALARNGSVTLDTNTFTHSACSTGTPPTDTPPTNNPPTDTPPTDNPPTDTPPSGTPRDLAVPLGTPPNVAPPLDSPPTDTPPRFGPPVAGPPNDGDLPGTGSGVQWPFVTLAALAMLAGVLAISIGTGGPSPLRRQDRDEPHSG